MKSIFPLSGFIFIIGILLNSSWIQPTSAIFNQKPILFSKVKKSTSNCFNFSPYYKIGQDPRRGSDIPKAQLIDALTTIRPYCDCIRIFGASSPLDSIPYYAKSLGFETVIANAWLDKDSLTNQKEVDNLIKLAKEGNIDKVVLGSEVLLRGELTAAELIAYINYTKAQLPDIPVATADVYGVLVENPEVLDAVDFIFYNAYPYWEHVGIDCAIYRFNQAYETIKSLVGDKPILVSESGWPSTGNTLTKAIPSLENMQYYIKHLRAWSQHNEVPVFIFAAFSEPWKYTTRNPQEAHWGIFEYIDSLGQLQIKPGMDGILLEELMPDTSVWACQFIESPNDTPMIIIDTIPEYGDRDGFLCGKVVGIRPCDVNVAVFIKVAGKWWTKPTFTTKVIRLDCNGEFCIDVVTGGRDFEATEFQIFLFDKDVDPPSVGGQPSLPTSLFEEAITSLNIPRPAIKPIQLFFKNKEGAAGTAIEVPICGRNINNVQALSGDFKASNGLSMVNLRPFNGDTTNLDFTLIDSVTMAFAYTTPIPLTVPDDSVVFILTVIIPPLSKDCYSLEFKNMPSPLEAVQLNDGISSTVPLEGVGEGLVCPIVLKEYTARIIFGAIENPLSDVLVFVDNQLVDTTNEKGVFNFLYDTKKDLNLHFQKPSTVKSGITITDLVLMNQYLQRKQEDIPLAIKLGMDTNGNGIAESIDRRCYMSLLLTKKDTIGQPIWRFIPNNFMQVAMGDSMINGEIPMVFSEMDSVFWGIKLGDVNYSYEGEEK